MNRLTVAAPLVHHQVADFCCIFSRRCVVPRCLDSEAVVIALATTAARCSPLSSCLVSAAQSRPAGAAVRRPEAKPSLVDESWIEALNLIFAILSFSSLLSDSQFECEKG